MSDDRICHICSRDIEQQAPITICPGCGKLYHDDCYRSAADCITAACRAAAGDQPPLAGGASALTAERRAVSLERASLPNRVKSGEFTSSGIALETSAGHANVAWENVEMLALGVIEEPFGSAEAQKSGLRSMVRKLFFGENQGQEQRVRKVRDVFLFDMFVRGQAHPYRFDGATVNYRAFLGDVSYASGQNFSRLVTRIVHGSLEARLDASLLAFLLGQREKVRHYGAIYDFELEAAQNRERLHALVPRREVQLDAERRAVDAPNPTDSEESV